MRAAVTLTADDRERVRRAIDARARKRVEVPLRYACVGCGRDTREPGMTAGCRACVNRINHRRYTRG